MSSFMPQRRTAKAGDVFASSVAERSSHTMIPLPDADAPTMGQNTPSLPNLAPLHRPLTPIPLFRPDMPAPNAPTTQMKQSPTPTMRTAESSSPTEATNSETPDADSMAAREAVPESVAGVVKAQVTMKQAGSGIAPVAPNGGDPPPAQRKNVTGLPDSLKAGVEALSGIALDDVRVRYNSAKPAEVAALAYAQGAEIYVGPGQEQHLPHEAWHVVQQEQGRVKPTLQAKGLPINDDRALETEADTMGERAAQTRDSRLVADGRAVHPTVAQRKLFVPKDKQLTEDDLEKMIEPTGKESIGALNAGVTTIQAGVSAIQSDKGVNHDGIDVINVGVSAIQAGVSAIRAGGSAIDTGVKTIHTGLSVIFPILTKMDAMQFANNAGVNEIHAGVNAILAGVGAILAGGSAKPSVGASMILRDWQRDPTHEAKFDDWKAAVSRAATYDAGIEAAQHAGALKIRRGNRRGSIEETHGESRALIDAVRSAHKERKRDIHGNWERDIYGNWIWEWGRLHEEIVAALVADGASEAVIRTKETTPEWSTALSACVSEALKAGNCFEFADVVIAKLRETTTNKHLYKVSISGARPLPATGNYDHVFGVISDHATWNQVIAAPSDATVVDAWFDGMVRTLRQYMEGENPYGDFLNPNNLAADRQIVSTGTSRLSKQEKATITRVAKAWVVTHKAELDKAETIALVQAADHLTATESNPPQAIPANSTWIFHFDRDAKRAVNVVPPT